jgi:hypothetical protein
MENELDEYKRIKKFFGDYLIIVNMSRIRKIVKNMFIAQRRIN